MPIYTYKCPKTNEVKEVIHGMTENPVIKSKEGNVMIRVPSMIQIAGMDNLGRSGSRQVTTITGKMWNWGS